MTKHPFLLVHGKGAGAQVTTVLDRLRTTVPGTAAMFARSRGRLWTTLLATVASPDFVSTGSVATIAPSALVALGRVGYELTRQSKVRTVGIWDLDAWVTRLPDMIDILNAAQTAITFFEVQAAIPSGLISRPERVVAWAETYLRSRLKKRERAEMSSNVIARDFFERAEGIRKDLGLDYLVGITRAMIAFEDAEDIYWNHFSFAENRLAIVSTNDLRDFSHRAERPFEAAVAGLIVSSVLPLMSRNLEFHDNRGCIFDYHPARYTIVDELRHPTIEPACLHKIPPSLRQSALALVQALAAYRGSP